ncbi:MAG TPA: anti-sigma factor [Acidimicrobiales bacterium]|nr:anti-sigma factor [Acidimicrobiales bacterium]
MADDTTPPTPDEAELDALRALRGDRPAEPVTWEEPPEGLWDRIAAELDIDAGEPGAPEVPDEPAAPAVPHLSAVPGITETSAVASPGGPPPAGGTPPDVTAPVPLRPRRPVVPWLVGAAAAAVLLVVGVAVLGDDSPSQQVVASVDLDRLGDAGSGAAELLEEDGRYRLQVDTADLDPGDGFLEVWVIDSEVSKLVSLGPVRPDGTYDLPPDLDPRQFPVVDVSVEPLDGDPAHSGDSVLRGQLTF